MSTLPLAFLEGLFPWPWLQIPALVLLIAIIVAWVIYRRKQM